MDKKYNARKSIILAICIKDDKEKLENNNSTSE